MRTSSRGPAPGPRQALLTLRIVGVSLGLGVTLFAFVGWFAGLNTDNRPADLGLLFGTFLIVAVLALAAAVLFWRARVVPLLAQTGDWSARFPGLQTSVIIVWALIEAPALLAEVVYFLYGDILTGALGLAVMWIGLAVTWPRRSWVGSA